jgi:hypothetical protein
MKITDALKRYKVKKADLEASLARIKVYQEALKTGNLQLLSYYTRKSADIGMPRTNKIVSPVEIEVLARNESEELNREIVKQWIDDEFDRFYAIRLEIQQIEAALKSLTRQERCIIEWKYFDSLTWNHIELSHMETFREALTEISLKKYNTSALNKLHRILKPFYDKFNYLY